VTSSLWLPSQMNYIVFFCKKKGFSGGQMANKIELTDLASIEMLLYLE
jgi:hypothetical protein